MFPGANAPFNFSADENCFLQVRAGKPSVVTKESDDFDVSSCHRWLKLLSAEDDGVEAVHVSDMDSGRGALPERPPTAITAEDTVGVERQARRIRDWANLCVVRRIQRWERRIHRVVRWVA